MTQRERTITWRTRAIDEPYVTLSIIRSRVVAPGVVKVTNPVSKQTPKRTRIEYELRDKTSTTTTPFV